MIRRYRLNPILVAGDFNARSMEWDVRRNTRGDLLADWAAAQGLLLVNRGTTPTCVHPRGMSSVDVTWANTAAIKKITEWEVDETAETLSDHRYIYVSVAMKYGTPIVGRDSGRRGLPRWNMRKLNRDLLVAAVTARTWIAPGEETSAEEWAQWLATTLEQASDVAMPRARAGGRKRAAYWWNDGIAELRTKSIRSRRRATRARGHVPSEVQVHLDRDVRIKRRHLREAIWRAKSKAWGELLATLDEDPWGRPYKLVLGRLRGPGDL